MKKAISKADNRFIRFYLLSLPFLGWQPINGWHWRKKRVTSSICGTKILSFGSSAIFFKDPPLSVPHYGRFGSIGIKSD
jgi:hypothetical protein